MSPAAADAPGPRRIVGRYRLEHELGRGAMGTVWAAYDEVLHRAVAVKEVRLSSVPVGERAIVRERTLREARSTAMLSHPNVVTLYDVVEVNSEPYVVMELLPSRSLASYIGDRGTLTQPEAAEIGSAVASALATAHRAGITHRDVKPGNVLIGENGQIKLTDFGIARNAAEQSMTQTGTVLGSPPYIAPEVAMGRAVGPAADLWGLGATLFACLEGRPPYDAGDPVGTVTEVVHGEVPVPSGRGPVIDVIRGLMVKDPALRMPLEAVRRRLRPLLSDPEGPVLAVSAGPRTAAFRVPPPGEDSDQAGLMRVPSPPGPRGPAGTLRDGSPDVTPEPPATAASPRPRPTPRPSPTRRPGTEAASGAAAAAEGAAVEEPATPAAEETAAAEKPAAAAEDAAADQASVVEADEADEADETEAADDAVEPAGDGGDAGGAAAAGAAVAAGVAVGTAAASTGEDESADDADDAADADAAGTASEEPEAAEPAPDVTPDATPAAESTAPADTQAEAAEETADEPPEAPTEAPAEDAPADAPADGSAVDATPDEEPGAVEVPAADETVRADSAAAEAPVAPGAPDEAAETTPETTPETTSETTSDEPVETPAATPAVATPKTTPKASPKTTPKTTPKAAEPSPDTKSTEQPGAGTERPRSPRPAAAARVPAPTDAETTMVGPRVPPGEDVTRAVRRPTPPPPRTTGPPTPARWTPPRGAPAPASPAWRPAAPPRPPAIGSGTGTGQRLAADPGPLPFTPSPRAAGPPRRSPWVVAAVVALLVLVAALGAVGAYALTRSLAGQPATLAGLAPAGPEVADTVLIAHADTDERYAGTGLGFSALVPAGWQQFRLEQAGGDVTVRFVSPDAHRELRVDRVTGFYPAQRATDYVALLSRPAGLGVDASAVGPLETVGAGPPGAEPPQQTVYRTTSGPADDRTTWTRLVPAGTDLWVVRLTALSTDVTGAPEQFRAVADSFAAPPA